MRLWTAARHVTPYSIRTQHQTASEEYSQPQCPAQRGLHAHSSCHSPDRKIVRDAFCRSCMLFLLHVFTCSATLTPPSTPRMLIYDSVWRHSSCLVRLDAIHGPIVEQLGSTSSGGMVLTISSLAEYTPLSNVCIDSSFYITASLSHLYSAFTA